MFLPSTWDFEAVTKDQHREFIQLAQSEAMAFEFETRLELDRDPQTHKVRLAKFEVFYDRWHTVATERNPMQADAFWAINPTLWTEVKAWAARDLSR